MYYAVRVTALQWFAVGITCADHQGIFMVVEQPSKQIMM